jgi:predicted nucleotidyltransferase
MHIPTRGVQEVISQAKTQLIEVIKRYESQGILAVYLWGSITRPDFDPITSDIDVVCIVKDTFPLPVNEEIREALHQATPEREWGFQIIYQSELQGAPKRSKLAIALDPANILTSFPVWIHVYGHSYRRSDFTLPDATLRERILIHTADIRRRMANIDEEIPGKTGHNRSGVVKACLHLVYFRQQLRLGEFGLDYNKLLDNADETERALLQPLLHIKNNKLYDKANFVACTPAIEEFLQRIASELK